jgi:hypothetical protein
MALRTPMPSAGATSRTRLRAFVVLLVLALGAAACGGDSGVEDDPEGALRGALEELADYDGIELLVQLSADEATRAQMLREGDLSEEDVELLLTASLLIRATGEDDEDGAAAFVLTVDDSAVAELRVLPDMELYLRLDLDRVLDLVDDPTARQDVDDLVAQAELIGLRDVAEAARRGEWIRITGLEQLLNLFGATPPRADDVDEDEADELAEELSQAAVRFLDDDVEVTYVGSDDAGERVRATTSGAALRRFLDDVNRIAASSDTLAAANPQDLSGQFDDIPDDAVVSLDAWISDGRLTQIALDLSEFDEDGEIEGELLLVVGIAEFTGSVDAPDDAVDVDLFGLIGGFMGGFGGPGLGAVEEDPFGDDAFEDDAFDEGEFDEGSFDDLEDACLSEEELDAMRSFLEPDQQAELDEAIEGGFIEVC